MRNRTGFIVLGGLLLLGAIGAAPRYIEELRIGGGPSDADGGMDIDKSGTLTTSGDIHLLDNRSLRVGTEASAYWKYNTGSGKAEWTDGTNVLMSLQDAGTTGNLDVTGNGAFGGQLTVGGGYGNSGATLSTAGAGQFNGTLTVDGDVSLGGSVLSTVPDVNSLGLHLFHTTNSQLGAKDLDILSLTSGDRTYAHTFEAGNNRNMLLRAVGYQNWLGFDRVNGSLTSPAAVANADELVAMRASGRNPSGTHTESDFLTVYVDGAPSGTTVPMSMHVGRGLSGKLHLLGGAGSTGATVTESGGINTDGPIATASYLLQSGNYQGIGTENLIALWHCSSAASLADYSGNNHMMSVQGTGTTLGANGKYGSCAVFNGSGYFQAGNNTIPSTYGGGSFTISAWIKTSVGSGTQTIAGWRSGSGTPFAALMMSGSSVDFYGYTTGNVHTYSLASGYNDNAWHHVVGVRDAANNVNRLYVDGVYQNQTAMTGSVAVAAPFRIGSYNGTDSFFNGSIDEVSFWNKALSESEVRALYMMQQELVCPAGTSTIAGNLTVSGDVAVNGGDITSTAQTLALTPATGGNVTVNGDLVVPSGKAISGAYKTVTGVAGVTASITIPSPDPDGSDGSLLVINGIVVGYSNPIY